jgi:hypothetical protein
MAVQFVKKDVSNINLMLHPPMFEKCKNKEEVEVKLGTWFHQQMQDFQVETDVPTIVDPQSKWRVTSCMQKAIRRGDVKTAVRMASALIEFDPGYILNRFNVIALEDVGLGNPTLIASIFAFSGSQKTLAKDYGLMKVAQFWAKGMAEGPKDRSLCNLVAMSEYGPAYSELRHKMGEKSWADKDADSINEFMNDLHSIPGRAIALRYFSGTDRYKADTYPERPGSYEGLMDYYWKYTSPLVAYIAQRASKKSVYCMWQCLSMSYNWLKDPKDVEVNSFTLPEAIPIKGVMSYAYDMHVQEGKRAYAYFAKSCEPLHNYMKEQGLVFGNLTGPAFIAETASCDKLVCFPELEALTGICEDAEFKGCGLTLQQGIALVTLIRENIPLLNQARQRVVVGK